MKKYEYEIKSIEAKGFIGGKVSHEAFRRTLNDMGSEGWELVEVVASNQDFGSTRYVICVFKRELK